MRTLHWWVTSIDSGGGDDGCTLLDIDLSSVTLSGTAADGEANEDNEEHDDDESGWSTLDYALLPRSDIVPVGDFIDWVIEVGSAICTIVVIADAITLLNVNCWT